MYVGKIKFNCLPDIGFAMRQYNHGYKAGYGRKPNSCIEIAYVNSGGIMVSMNGEDMYAPEGSIVVLFRHLPVETKTVGEGVQSHDTVLGEFANLEFTLGYGDDTDGDKLTIPFVTKPSARTERIGIQLRKIQADMSANTGDTGFCASIAFLSILSELADIYNADNLQGRRTNENVLKIKEYIDDNIDKKITLSDLSHLLNKSPNHVGRIFKTGTGMSVTEYTNIQKVKKISFLIKNKDISFKKACEAAGVCDELYGYRIFKKYIGLTPGEFLKTTHIEL